MTPIEITGKIVELLTPVEPGERARILNAARVLLGETGVESSDGTNVDENILPSASPRVHRWLKENSIGLDQIHQVFHFENGTAEVIATIPGKGKKEQTINAYVLTGISNFLSSGEPLIGDKTARELCERSGCYDLANHSAHMKSRGTLFAGSKEKGWTLTSPGLKRGAELIRELNK